MSIQTQYNFYVSQGLTHEGALALLGNAKEESGNVSYRKQGDFSEGFTASRAYTQDVDSGRISRATFCAGKIGYGLYQWTYQPRQQWLYDAAKKEGVSIGDEAFQLRFSVWELKTHYPGTWMVLTNSHDLYACTKVVCEKYENPAVWNTNVRYNDAVQIEKELKATPKPTAEPQKPTYWPPRTIDKNMSGPDVEVLQAILKARGYAINYIGGKFDALLDAETREFQKNHGLTADGVCGPMTWAKLLGVKS